MIPGKKSAAQGKGMRSLYFTALLARSLLILLSASLASGVGLGFYLEDDNVNGESLHQESQSSAVWKVVKISEVRRSDKAPDGMLQKQKIRGSQVYLEVLAVVQNVSDQEQTLFLPNYPGLQPISIQNVRKVGSYSYTEIVTDASRSFIERAKILGALDPNSKIREPVASKEELALSIIFIVPKKWVNSDLELVFIGALPQPLVSTEGSPPNLS